MHDWKRYLAAAIAVTAVGFASAAIADGAVKMGTSDLSGHWVLNEKLSDKPGMPGGGGSGGGHRGGGGMGGGHRGGGGGGWGGGGGGMGGGGMRGGPPPDAPDGAPAADAERSGPRGPLTDMVVEQYAEQILLSQRGKVERRFVFQAGDVPRMTSDGVPQVKAAWDNGKLVIDQTTPRGRMLETWELSKNGQQLVVLTHIQRGEGDAMDRKRVYDLVSDK